eukprot:g11191.t1
MLGGLGTIFLCARLPSFVACEDCYMQVPLKGQWICSCTRANLLKEDFCRGCGGKSPERRQRDLDERQRAEEQQRLEALARQERAERNQLTAMDLAHAHSEGFKLLPTRKGWEEAPRRRTVDREAYKNLLRFAAWKAGRDADLAEY